MDKQDKVVQPIYYAKSSFFMNRKNKFRKLVVRLINNKWFERFIICAILINALTMCLYNFKFRRLGYKEN